MASKLFAVFCVQMVLLNLSYAQVLTQLLAPPCGCGLPVPLPTPCPTFPSQPISYLPPAPSVIYDQPTTIIQDSTVANNLANALQLLVVSNLLSSALPLDPPAPVYAPFSAPLYNPLELSAPLTAPLITQRAPCGCGCSGLNPGYTILY